MKSDLQLMRAVCSFQFSSQGFDSMPMKIISFLLLIMHKYTSINCVDVHLEANIFLYYKLKFKLNMNSPGSTEVNNEKPSQNRYRIETPCTFNV